MIARNEDHMRLVKKITEIYEDGDDEADDLAAVDGVVVDDAGSLGDPDPDDEPGEDDAEEPEARPRSRT